MINSYKLTADLLAMRPMMEAYLKGEKIETKSPIDGSWVDVGAPSWLSGVEYRVKPKPYEGWVAVYSGDRHSTSKVFNTETDAKTWLEDVVPISHHRDWRIIFIREVK